MGHIYQECVGKAEEITEALLESSKLALLAAFGGDEEALPAEFIDEVDRTQSVSRRWYREAFETILHAMEESGDSRCRLMQREFDEVLARWHGGHCTLEAFRRAAMSQQVPYVTMGFSLSTIELWASLAETERHGERWDGAAAVYALLSSLEPDQSDWWVAWCETLLAAGRHSEALTPAYFLEMMDEESPYPRYFLAQCYYALRDFHQGDLFCEEALCRCRGRLDYEELHRQIASLQQQAR